MARIIFVPRTEQDFRRFRQRMAEFDVPDQAARIERLVRALDVLGGSPLIGRRAGAGRRELIIGTAQQGFVALYLYVPAIETVYILALRHQRESGYKLNP